MAHLEPMELGTESHAGTHEKPEVVPAPYKPDVSWSINGINMNSAIKQCFAKPGTIMFPPAHEAMGWAYSHFQDYLLGEKLKGLDKKFEVQKVEVYPENAELMKPVTETLAKAKDGNGMETNTQVAKMKKYFTSLENFKNVRFGLVQGVLPDTVDSASTGSSMSSSTKQIVLDDIEKSGVQFLRDLRQLVLVAFEHCRTFCAQFESEFKSKKDKEESMRNQPLFAYANFWKNYMQTALELEVHLAPIVEAMNEVTDGYYIKASKHYPRFHIYRILVEVFIQHCYAPLKGMLLQLLRKYLEDVSVRRVYYQTMTRVKEIAKYTPMELLDFFASQVTKDQMTYTQMIDDTFQLCQCIRGFLDMHVNEVNVHYIHIRSFLSKVSNTAEVYDFIKCVDEVFGSVLEKITKKPEMAAIKNELVADLLNEYHQLLPPSFLENIEDARRGTILKETKEEVKEHLESYLDLGPGPKNSLIEEADESEPSLYLQDMIKELVDQNGDSLGEEDKKGFMQYLRQNAAESVINKCMELEEGKANEEYTDYVINERNEKLGIELTQAIDDLYAMSGMTRSRMEKLK